MKFLYTCVLLSSLNIQGMSSESYGEIVQQMRQKYSPHNDADCQKLQSIYHDVEQVKREGALEQTLVVIRNENRIKFDSCASFLPHLREEERKSLITSVLSHKKCISSSSTATAHKGWLIGSWLRENKEEALIEELVLATQLNEREQGLRNNSLTLA
jgi:hypothetical protein